MPIGQANLIDSLPFGHYLAVNTRGKQINFSTLSRSYFKLQTYGYNDEIWHILTDQENKVITDAKLSIRDKRLSIQSRLSLLSR